MNYYSRKKIKHCEWYGSRREARGARNVVERGVGQLLLWKREVLESVKARLLAALMVLAGRLTVICFAQTC